MATAVATASVAAAASTPTTGVPRRAPRAAAPPAIIRIALVAAMLILPRGGGASTDFRFDWAKERWYNPSLVVSGDVALSAAKVTQMKRIGKKNWWINTLHMCEGPAEDLQALRCKRYDPWGGQYKECEFDDRVRNGKLDTAGLGDVKVWRWPGKGVYTIFSRKPERNATDKFCNGFVVYHPWIHQVKTEGRPGMPDAWNLQQPMPLTLEPTHEYPDHLEYTMEKNWMPFVYKDAQGVEHLYVTYHVMPHMVFEVMPNGQTVHRWTTSSESLKTHFGSMDVHGGPPLAYVPAHLSGSGEPYYLGVLHSIERFNKGSVRLYRHFAFKVSPHPPFDIVSLSDELPLTFNTNIRARVSFVAFASGLDVTPAGDVLLTYGAADAESRVQVVPVRELEGLFTGRVAFRETHVPYESDAPAPAAGADTTEQQPEEQQQQQQLEQPHERRRRLHTVGSRRLGSGGAAPVGAGMLGSGVGAGGADKDDGCRLF